jgi:hypothetical protein
MEGHMQIFVLGPLMLAVVAISATAADAVITQRVKNACRSEYYAFCSAHAVPSAGLRSCMRGVQDQLSQACLKELVAAGEVSKNEVRRYSARQTKAQR